MNIPLGTENMVAEVDGPIGWITFNKPSRRNAVSLDMWQAIPVILDHFEQDPAIRVIVLKGAGETAFISGADISEFEEAPFCSTEQCPLREGQRRCQSSSFELP